MLIQVKINFYFKVWDLLDVNWMKKGWLNLNWLKEVKLNCQIIKGNWQYLCYVECL